MNEEHFIAVVLEGHSSTRLPLLSNIKQHE